MTEDALKQRNQEMLVQCWPAFAAKVRAIISDMAAHGFRCRIQQAWRSPAEQLADFNSGHSKLKFGFHNCTGPNGEKQSLAVDMLDDDRPNRETTKYSLMLYASAVGHGLMTGGVWFTGPNKDSKRSAFVSAAASKNWGANVEVGWDNCHIQPSSITITQAKAGTRL